MPRDSVGAGKGSDPRPCLVSREENDLRWKLAFTEGLSPEDRMEIEQRIKVLVSERAYGRT
jgi:hypothetical protein